MKFGLNVKVRKRYRTKKEIKTTNVNIKNLVTFNCDNLFYSKMTLAMNLTHIMPKDLEQNHVLFKNWLVIDP